MPPFIVRAGKARDKVKTGMGSLNICPLPQPRAFGRAVVLLLSALNSALASVGGEIG